MSALLVLAIAASSALVFTDRVELLKLAVILALWAAVVAAFVSVIYRRQSDSDQAKVRDLKLVYDLQLEREISARREYELTVESHLRRELASELRAQSADEVAALRAELAALRANLEYLFDADLSERPALERDRAEAPSLPTAGRVSSSRIDTEDADARRAALAIDVDEHSPDTEESPIIDVPAEPHPDDGWPRVPEPAEPAGGAHRRAGAPTGPWAQQPAQAPPTPQPTQTPPPPPQASPHFPWLPSQSTPQAPPPPRQAPSSPGTWQPAPAEGRFIPAGQPGSHWASPPVRPEPEPVRPEPEPIPEPEPEHDPPFEYVGRRRAPEATESPEPPRGRHSSASDPVTAEPSTEDTAEAEAEADDEDGGAHTGGQSVAELLARLQASPTGGGRRRRRED